MNIKEEDFPLGLNDFLRWQKIAGGIELEFSFEKVRINFISNSVIKLHISRGGKFDTDLSASCLEFATQLPDFTIEEEDDSLLLAGGILEIKVDLKPFSLTVFRQNSAKPIYDSGDQFYRYNNDEILIERPYDPTDAIYGLGQKTGPFQRNGQAYTLWNTDILAPDVDGNYVSHDGEPNDPLGTSCDPYYMSIPFFCQVDAKEGLACASFIDNPHKATYSFSDEKSLSKIEMTFSGGQFCEYIFAGPQLKNILSDYAEITGTMALPPLWSLGYHQCRWHKYKQEEVVELAERHRAEGLPCDSLWLDIDHMDKYRVFTWNDELFDDRETFFKRLKELDFKCISIIDPGVKYEKGYGIFDEAYEKDYFCKTQSGNIYLGQAWPGHTAFPDFSQENVRTWWGGLNADWSEQGIDGIWNDMNEPATGNVSPQAMRFDRAGKNASHDRFHNEYGLLMAEATYTGLLERFPNKRPFILSRAGSPGIQRYAANWLGDNAARWEHLRMALSMSLGLSLSGVPFTGADIGGFVEASSPELFVRWMQYATLSPFCRNHNDHDRDQYAWSFGLSVEKLCRRALELRYRLLPYFYTCFQQAHEFGEPIQRPLIYEYQQDPAVRDIEDQFLLGDKILVAPVLEKGQTQKHIYFPAASWYDWQNDEVFAGESFHTVDAPIAKLPLFIKAGSVVPLWPEAVASTAQLPLPTIQWHLYLPFEDGVYKSELYEDDGDGFHYRDQESYLKTTFEMTRRDQSVVFSATTDGLGFEKFNRTGISLFVHGNQNFSLLQEGKLLVAERDKSFYFANSGEDLHLIIDLS